ncbi:MAG: PAS domain S-box protein [Deltaproteobacteria bacterium]|nr:PAS domain S-box protein [Deltaproteobacteria bacterium]
MSFRRRAEEKLRRSEEGLRRAFEHAPIGVLLLDGDTRIERANYAVCALLGYAEEELLGRPVADFIHPDDRPASDHMRARVLAGEIDEFATGRRALSRDGRVLTLEVRTSVQRAPDGSVDLIVTQIVDVTERKRAEDTLRDSEARYRSLVELSQDLIVRMDLEGRLTFVNDAWCAKFGLRREEAIGRSVVPRIVPTDQVRTVEALRALTRPPHQVRIEIRQRTTEGLRWIEWEGRGIFDERGTVLELQGIGRDITHEHEAAEALRASEARYRGLVESQEAVVLRLDLERRITFVNDYACRAIGLPREAMLGRDVLEWIPPEDREVVRAAITREIAPPHRARAECRVRVAAGLRWFHWDGTLMFDERGAPLELQAVGFDVTERREAADALRSSLEELRQSRETLRLLAQRQAAVREEERKRVGFDLHDGVCQELIGIGILVESVRNRCAPALGTAESDLRRVTAYVNEVVEHLRRLAGELRPMLLQDLGLEGSLRSLALGLGSEATEVDAVFRATVPRLDEATEVAVYRIAQEALANALRHARARRVELAVDVDGGRLRLTVRDDGRGFEAGRRRTAALGLLSMEERALALGGRLEVRSRPGHGTVVRLDCPLVVRAGADGG